MSTNTHSQILAVDDSSLSVLVLPGPWPYPAHPPRTMIFLDSWKIEALVLGLTALSCYYIYFKTCIANFWLKRNIPFLKTNFLIGNLYKMGITIPMNVFFTDLYNKHKEKRIVGMWALHKPFILIMDREIIKNILTRDFSNFSDRLTMDVGEHDPLANGNLFNLSGHAWRNMRVKLTPAFTTGKMKMMYTTIVKCGAELEEFIEKSKEKVLDLKDISSRYTMNVIGSCAFGIETNALQNPNSDFVRYGSGIFKPTMTQVMTNMLVMALPFVGRIFKISTLPKGTTEFFINTVKDTIEYRKANNVERKDIMQLLMQLKEKGVIEDVDRRENEGDQIDTKFTINEVAAQAFVFFAAGFESSSVTMALAFYELARNADIQNKLRSEIRNAMEKENGELSYETITRLDYLECVIQETLRKYPVVPVLFREASKDYYVPEMDITIPGKTPVMIPNVGLVQDAEFFPEPEKFDPERFSAARKDEIPAFCHMPFGEGPRNCIGSRFGLLQTKVGLVSILGHYRVETSSKTPDPIKYGIFGLTISIDGGLYLKLVKDH